MPDTPTPSIDVLALLRDRRYLVLLIIVAILAVPIAAAAYWFLYLVSDMQKWVFNPAYLPKALVSTANQPGGPCQCSPCRVSSWG